MSRISRIRFEAQLEDGYSLPACACMVLAALGMSQGQEEIARRLGTSDAGTPFSRLRRLADRSLHVDVQTGGDVETVTNALAADIPVITAVLAEWLPYAQVERPHAVVVIGITSTDVSVLDPAATSDAITVPIDAWLASWIEMDCTYALITQR